MRRDPQASRRATSVRRRGGRLSRHTTRLGLALGAALTLALVVGVTLAGAVAPTVTIGNAAAVSYTSAHATGKVDPQGQSTTYRFQYLSDARLQENITNGFSEWEFAETAKEEAIEGAEQTVEADLSNLRPGTNYHLRLVAENGDGPAEAVAAAPFTTEATGPPTVTIAAPTDVTGTTVHLSGTIDPEAPAGNPSAFDVNWHFECDPACTSTGGTVAANTNPVPVSETLSGLEPNTAYEITLVASNAGAQATAGPVGVSTEGVGPAVQTLFAGETETGSAALAGRVNPENSTTTYQFEWGTGAGYGNLAPAAAQTLNFSDRDFHVVTASLTGLAPAATYHFRIVATNTETGETSRGEDHTVATLETAGASAPCSNAEFRSGKSQDLPDCRAYEQVTPREKEYGLSINTSPQPFTAQSAAEGGRVAYGMGGPIPGSAGSSEENVYLSDRGGTGWGLQPLNPPLTVVPGAGGVGSFFGFSPDLRFTGLTAAEPALAPGATPGVANLYLREDDSNTYRLLSLPQDPTAGQRTAAKIAGMSADGSHVAFEFNSTPSLVPGGGTLYEWDDGALRSVAGDAGANFGNANLTRYFNGISQDGHRIVFVADEQVFVREDGTRTIDASEARRTVPDPGSSTPNYWGSSSDGNIVLFTSTIALTNDAVIGGGEQLYAFNIANEELTDLDADAGQADPEGPRVLGVVGQSEDAGYVYFVARGDLGGDGVSGTPNLYLWHGGIVAFITSLDEADSGNWTSNASEITSRVSPDGRHLLLTSRARLTPYDNTDRVTGQPDPELYRYAAESGRLDCATCRPDGQAPEGGGEIQLSNYAQVQRQRYFQRYMTDDGSKVVWATREALVPRDVNGRLDVYEDSNGRVSLLSTGTGEFPTLFADMNADGSDVFLGTVEQLVKGDTDGFADLYDARVDGGLAEPPTALPPCAGGECTRDASTPPGASPIGSVGLQGRGNQRAERRCPKGKHAVRRHGKKSCGKKRKKHKHQKHSAHKQTRGAGSARGGSK